MTTFTDGPAKGQNLMLQRIPKYLRVTEENGKFDALNNLTDTPRATEKIYAYIHVGQAGYCHIRRKGGGGFYAIASYQFIPEQPVDSVMRSEEAWTKWVYEQAAKA